MVFSETFEPVFTKVVGVTFEDRQAVCEQLHKGAALSLIREPDNYYDTNAIGVLFKGKKCGYISRDLAADLVDLIDGGLNLEAIVTEVNGFEKDNGFITSIVVLIQKKYVDDFEENTDNDVFSPDFMHWITDKDKSEITLEPRDTSFELTHEQKKIIEYDIDENSILNIIAFAGTGKTTTLLEYSKAHSHLNFLYVAFNKSVQVEAKEKFPPNVTCKTSHGLAFRKFGAPYKDRIISNLRLNTVKSALGLNNYNEAKIVSETFYNFLISADLKISKKHLPWLSKDDPKLPYFYISKAAELWVLMCDENDGGVGMLHDCYLKLYHLSRPQLNFDCILLDEAQDTNPVVADIIVSQKCPKILVGDPHQQIYAFRGSHNIMQHISAEKTLYLTYSFRFGEEIARIANKILHNFKGETRELKGVRPLGNKGDFEDFAIIARTNAMIFTEAVNLCHDGCKIAFLGGIDGYRFNDIMDIYLLNVGKKAEIKNSHIRSFTTYSALKEFAEEADDWELKSKYKIVEKYGERLPILVEYIKRSAVERAQAQYILTTAHKSKGSQFSKVRLCEDFSEFFLDNELSDGTSIDPEEFNLLYVAVTRAKESITIPHRLQEFIDYYRPKIEKEEYGTQYEEIDTELLSQDELNEEYEKWLD